MQRRSFVKTLALATTWPLAGPLSAQPTKKMKRGIQLYYLKQTIGQDLPGTLKKIAEMGYQEVEGFSMLGTQYFGQTAKAFGQMLADAGLKIRSSHVWTGQQQPAETAGLLQMVGMKELPPPGPVHGFLGDDSRQRLIEAAVELGQTYLGCVMTFPSERATPDACKRTADMLNQAGQACRAAGLQLLYHNHDFEFAPLAGGPSAYDLLLAETDPGLVKFEADLYWFSKARVDLLALFAKYPGRFPVWHFKDMDNTAQQGFAEVGTGVIDFKKYLAQAKLAGLKHYFVEQDLVKGRTELESAQLSLAGLKKLGL